VSPHYQRERAILVMDCQNDIVHEQGKVGGSLTNGRMQELSREKSVRNDQETGRGWESRSGSDHSSAACVSARLCKHARHVQIFQGHEANAALQEGTWGAEIQPISLRPVNFVLTKTRVSAFYASPLERYPAGSGHYASRAHWSGDGWRGRKHGPRWS